MVRPWAKKMKSDVVMLWFALRHKRTPLHAKVFGAVVVAYALSPIDLIPDFIPVLGLIDDLILVPVGIALILPMIPSDVKEECRSLAAQSAEKPNSLIGAILIGCTWLLLVVLCGLWAWHRFSPKK